MTATKPATFKPLVRRGTASMTPAKRAEVSQQGMKRLRELGKQHNQRDKETPDDKQRVD